MNWSSLHRIIQRADKQYPYKLWFKYAIDDNSPGYYIIESKADEELTLKHLSKELRYSFELIKG